MTGTPVEPEQSTTGHTRTECAGTSGENPRIAEREPDTEGQFSKVEEFLLQDATRRHEALVQLIYHSDRKAVQLIGTYFTLVTAVLSALLALSNFGRLSRPALLSLLVAAGLFFVGVLQSYRAQWTSDLSLTGRKPDFGQWARDHQIEPQEIVRTYLETVAENLEKNERLNEQMAAHLKCAYAAGLAAPPFATLIYFWALRFIP